VHATEQIILVVSDPNVKSGLDYHDAVLDTVSLIALEAYDFMTYIFCIGVLYLISYIFMTYIFFCCSTHYVFPAVSFVCQTSTVVAVVPAVSAIVYMWHAIVSHYVSC
jgi:hypothetical protein